MYVHDKKCKGEQRGRRGLGEHPADPSQFRQTQSICFAGNLFHIDAIHLALFFMPEGARSEHGSLFSRKGLFPLAAVEVAVATTVPKHACPAENCEPRSRSRQWYGAGKSWCNLLQTLLVVPLPRPERAFVQIGADSRPANVQYALGTIRTLRARGVSHSLVRATVRGSGKIDGISCIAPPVVSDHLVKTPRRRTAATVLLRLLNPRNCGLSH